MLQLLRIKNLALLDRVELEFAAGFSAVTGETGAGKSVLLGALSLLSGARTDKTMIRQGSDELEVEAALFFADTVAIDGALEALGLPPCEEGVLLLQRRIHRTKMPRILVNGGMATLAQLEGLGESWIDFHGPGEPQKLFQEKRQLEMLDAFAGLSGQVRDYQQGYAQWQDALREIERLETGERLEPEELEFVAQQIRKIESIEISESAIAELEREFTRMARAQELLELALQSAERLGGEASINDLLAEVLTKLESIAEIDAQAAPLVERARSLQIETQDLAAELEQMAGDCEFDAEEVEAVSERMNLWQELRRKFGGSVEAVLAKRDHLKEKIALQGNIDAVLEERREAAARMEAGLQAEAEAMSAARRKAAGQLSAKTAKLLSALGFKKARLEIEVMATESLHAQGNSRCRFLFAPNAGQDLCPLNKIASSGETARVMLALKTILAEGDATPLLVFDEVDANVGGEVGRAVGAELARLAAKHQVLCVTHLPQVAAQAHSHFVVEKRQQAKETTVRIGPIGDSPEARLEEIARMLGDRSSRSAKAHAAELLEAGS